MLLDPPGPGRARHAVIALDEHAAAAPRIPGPRFVADVMRVGPGHELRNVRRSAARAAVRLAGAGTGVHLAGLGKNHRHDFCDWSHTRVEADARVAPIVAEYLRFGDRLVTGIGRSRF